ncbi:MAG: 4Fe-4S binding protein [Bacteroidota bacterium]
MGKLRKSLMPFIIGLLVAMLLYFLLHWWGFLIIFPWIGFSISLGIFLRHKLKGKERLIGRKVSILMILPCLLIFVPVINNENFQLEGVFMIVLVGFFSKGFIHYAIAKIFGPLIWRRGFCGYACWTAAALDWLPIKTYNNNIPRSYRNIRFITLAISLLIPAYMIFMLSYNPRTDYINKHEMIWMFISNGLYYLIAIPLAFILSDKRAFCKYICPVALVMTPSTKIGLIKIKSNINIECTECGSCNNHCPMGVDVMNFMKNNKPITDTECILCSDCKIVCPTNKIK